MKPNIPSSSTSVELLHPNCTKAPSNVSVTIAEGTLAFTLGIRIFHLHMTPSWLCNKRALLQSDWLTKILVGINFRAQEN